MPSPKAFPAVFLQQLVFYIIFQAYSKAEECCFPNLEGQTNAIEQEQSYYYFVNLRHKWVVMGLITYTHAPAKLRSTKTFPFSLSGHQTNLMFTFVIRLHRHFSPCLLNKISRMIYELLQTRKYVHSGHLNMLYLGGKEKRFVEVANSSKIITFLHPR